MNLTPQKISLIAQTQAILLEGMRQKRWQHVLPGERLLSQELRISRWTLRAALAGLAKDGYVAITHGVPCKIMPSVVKAKGQAATRNFALLAPAPLSRMRLFVALWVDELRKILGEEGVQLNIYECPRAYQANPGQALEHLVKRHPNNDWILFLSTRAIQEWFQERKRFAVVAGTRFDGIRLPAIDVTCHAAGVHAGHTLLGLGHRQIALINPRIPTAGVLAFEAGLREIMEKSRSDAVGLEVVNCEEETSAICKALDRLLAKPKKPSVVIGARASSALTAFSHLTRLGLRVPGDISLLSVEWEPFLDLVVPHVAHYEVSPVRFARQMAKILQRSSAVRAGVVQLDLQFIAGESLRRVPA